MARRALAQVRVLDLGSGIAAPLAARLLGDFGADVIKVEPTGGDPSRQLRPLLADGPVAERSLLFAYLNWNKRGITLDYGSAEARATIEALVRSSDIVIESFKPGTLAGWGMSPQQMLGWNPRVVVTSVSDFGQEGPYSRFIGSDLVQQAMSGIMQISGQAERAPLKHGLDQAYLLRRLERCLCHAGRALRRRARRHRRSRGPVGTGVPRLRAGDVRDLLHVHGRDPGPAARGAGPVLWRAHRDAPRLSLVPGWRGDACRDVRRPVSQRSAARSPVREQPAALAARRRGARAGRAKRQGPRCERNLHRGLAAPAADGRGADCPGPARLRATRAARVFRRRATSWRPHVPLSRRAGQDVRDAVVREAPRADARRAHRRRYWPS